MTGSNDTVVAYVGIKDAAIYFPYVVSMVSYHFEETLEEAFARGNEPGKLLQDVVSHEILGKAGDLTKLLPEHMKTDRVFLKLLSKVPLWDTMNSMLSMLEATADSSGKREEFESVVAKIGQMMKVNLMDDGALGVSWDTLWRKHNLGAYPLILPESWVADSGFLLNFRC